MRRAVFLDRDGVINRAIVRDGRPYPPMSLNELEILPGVAEALVRLRGAGFLNVVVTNQPDVGARKVSRSVVDALHATLVEQLAIDRVKVCYHVEADGCACRKPKPGMLREAAAELAIDLPASYLVGDRWRDIEAGQAAGVQCFFIDYAYREKKPEQPYVPVTSLGAAAAVILTPSQGFPEAS